MNMAVRETNGIRFMEGIPGEKLLKTVHDVNDMLGFCFGEHAGGILLHPEHLTDGFFDLSTGEAGAILQKLRNYHIRLAVVVPLAYPLSDRFREMAAEENKGVWFHVCGGHEEAVTWLAGG